MIGEFSMTAYPSRRAALTGGPWLVFAGSLLALGMLGALLYQRPDPVVTGPSAPPLVVYCAAGMKPPVEQAAREYEETCGTKVQLQFGGSGTLLSNLRIAKRGDLYLAADNSYIVTAREQGLVAESLPLALLEPVIAVKKGNPKNIRSLPDLLRDDVLVALANPDAAAIGRISRQLLEQSGQWEPIAQRAKVFKPTVNDVANDIRLAGIDAGIIWDATANQYPELEAVRVPAFQAAREQVTIGVLKSTTQPTAALRFARYLAARDRGLLAFKQHGFSPVDGDVWAETPEITLYSGGVNRVAIEDTVNGFQQREGVIVTTVFNGCGILTAQMRAITKGQRPDAFPDAYLACDVSFMDNVQDLFLDSIDVSETDMVLVVPKGNPKGIHTLADLTRPDLRIGLAHPQTSALGKLSERLLQELGLHDAIEPNVKTRKPTADFLVTDMRAGALDAVIVYRANTAKASDDLDVLDIDHPAARAIQPYAVSRQSKHKHLLDRLLQAITTPESQAHFETVGFRIRAGSSES
jgi:molybdenum ABC transporter molybdate-binding protein